MSHYWALFREIDGCRFRFDTRIYLQPCDSPRRGDKAIGRIIGKNPGSACPSVLSGTLQAIRLQGDHFLPSVLSVVRKANFAGPAHFPPGAFVRVHNLFYLCDRDLRGAKHRFGHFTERPVCNTERLSVPWTWFAWGGPDKHLDPLKSRFLAKRPPQSFFFCGDTKKVQAKKPDIGDRARHTQGMPHTAVVAHLATQVVLPGSRAASQPTSASRKP